MKNKSKTITSKLFNRKNILILLIIPRLIFSTAPGIPNIPPQPRSTLNPPSEEQLKIVLSNYQEKSFRDKEIINGIFNNIEIHAPPCGKCFLIGITNELKSYLIGNFSYLNGLQEFNNEQLQPILEKFKKTYKNSRERVFRTKLIDLPVETKNIFNYLFNHFDEYFLKVFQTIFVQVTDLRKLSVLNAIIYKQLKTIMFSNSVVFLEKFIPSYELFCDHLQHFNGLFETEVHSTISRLIIFIKELIKNYYWNATESIDNLNLILGIDLGKEFLILKKLLK